MNNIDVIVFITEVSPTILRHQRTTSLLYDTQIRLKAVENIVYRKHSLSGINIQDTSVITYNYQVSLRHINWLPTLQFLFFSNGHWMQTVGWNSRNGCRYVKSKCLVLLWALCNVILTQALVKSSQFPDSTFQLQSALKRDQIRKKYCRHSHVRRPLYAVSDISSILVIWNRLVLCTIVYLSISITLICCLY